MVYIDTWRVKYQDTANFWQCRSLFIQVMAQPKLLLSNAL